MDLEDFVMIALAILLMVCGIFVAAAVFAAPGYVVLLLAGHEDVGFWNSAAAGLGTIIIGGLVGSLIQAARCK